MTGEDYRSRVEEALDRVLTEAVARPPALAQAMCWAVEGGGKRIRPLICLAAAAAAGGDPKDALMPACAIELLHSYTLVHDDLPAMDDDRERRGKPSVWARFGEANAILAGDALQGLAFRTAARAPRNVPRILAALGEAAVGVVAGQVEDVAAAGAPVTPDVLAFVFRHKTGDLFVAAAAMGALAAGASDAVVAALTTYARELGMAFQYEDDLLDGEDGAFSSLSLFGRDEVAARVARHTAAARAALTGLPGEVGFLDDLAARLACRRA